MTGKIPDISRRRWLTAILLLLGLAACSRQLPEAERREYAAWLEAQRAAKDSLFKNSDNSPLTPEQRTRFIGLNYFSADLAWRVEARFVKDPNPAILRMQTSTPEQRYFVRNGRLEFKLQGRQYALMTYQDSDPGARAGHEDSLFVPFTDGTTGKQSYGGGRYLELKLTADHKVTVDFNLAYNPYCAYNHNYSCPLPPPENHLFATIEAGEKAPAAD